MADRLNVLIGDWSRCWSYAGANLRSALKDIEGCRRLQHESARLLGIPPWDGYDDLTEAIRAVMVMMEEN